LAVHVVAFLGDRVASSADADSRISAPTAPHVKEAHGLFGFFGYFFAISSWTYCVFGIGGDAAFLVGRRFMNAIQALDIQVPAEVIHNWGWYLAFGIGLVALGVAAVARSVAATVVSMLFFGWLMVIAAGIEIAQTILVGH
jgi:hypothetical protein